MGARFMIEFQAVHKSYRVMKTRPGLAAAVKALFSPVYDRVDAVQDLSFRIEAGELVGLIGENGAGKSMVVKMATGILHPTRGKVLFEGLEVSRHRKRCALRYGVVFGQRKSLWWQLSGRSGLEALGRIYRLDRTFCRQRISELVDAFELGDFVDKQVRQMSLGQRIRCEVAACFIHRPKIVFLDEPTIGMDSLAKIRMREYLKEINRRDGVSVLLTSHDLFDIERVCERIMIMDKGRLLLNETFESMRRRFRDQRLLRLRLASPADGKPLSQVSGVVALDVVDRWSVNVRFDPAERPVVDLLADLQQHLEIADFTVENLPIDEFVAQVYRSQTPADQVS